MQKQPELTPLGGATGTERGGDTTILPREMENGPSPIWGGIKLALILGALVGLIGLPFGWGGFDTGLKAMAVAYTLLTLASAIPGTLLMFESTPVGGRPKSQVLREVVIELALSAGLIAVAFFRVAR